MLRMKSIKPTASDLLWHFALGYLPDFLDKCSGPVGWVRWSHRGVQFLDKFQVPRKQRPYVRSPHFELRFNTAFEEVVGGCANPSRDYIQRRGGKSWITPDLKAGLMELHRMGYAHSFETWQEEELVGGIWGVQIGGLITMSSMFNRVSNASKFAMARTMMHLQKRGFTMVDMGMVPDHLVHFGAEWVPRWRFEKLLPGLLKQRLTLVSGIPIPTLPMKMRWGTAAVRIGRAVRMRVVGNDGPAEAMTPKSPPVEEELVSQDARAMI